MLTGTLVNVATVLVGSLAGMLLGKAIPKRVIDIITKGLGLCTVYLGITGMFDGENPLIAIISIVVGAAIGELCDLDGKINRLGSWVESKTKKEGSTVPVAEGFVSASLLFCVGAMTIMGSLQSGLSGDHSILFAKSTLDLVSSMIFASTLGFGVMLAAGSVFVIQGGIAVLAHPYLYKNEALLEELTELGLDGVEVWHPSQNEEQRAELMDFARKHNLLMTGGSDFHGMYTRTTRSLASTTCPDERVKALLAYKDAKKKG